MAKKANLTEAQKKRNREILEELEEEKRRLEQETMAMQDSFRQTKGKSRRKSKKQGDEHELQEVVD